MAALTTEDSAAVSRFQKFLQIPSVSANGPNGPYQRAVEFLQDVCTSFGFTEQKIVEIVPRKPILIVSYPGANPSLKSIVLNSHYDVVPADAAAWRLPPFEAQIQDGKIFARGTQDMKCVCMQYVEALGRIKALVDQGKLPKPQRTIHLTFLPDEEIGGLEGAKLFTGHPSFKALEAACALDEGLANPNDAYTVFYGERAPWWVKITAKGPVGHGSRFIPGTAIEKLSGVLNKIYTFRSEQQKLLHPTGDCDHGCSHSMAKKLGDVVTVNVTAVSSFVPGPAFCDGFAINCIPPEAVLAMDIRFPPTVSMPQMEDIIKKWTSEEGLSYSFYTKMPEHNVTSADNSSPWWRTLSETFKSLGRNIEPEIFPAATDSRYFRMEKLPCYGFSPMRKTPILLHDHNEFIEVDMFLEGIRVYESLVPALANNLEELPEQK